MEVENGENEMMIETSRLNLREMNMDDYDALYEVLADSDIMLHYPYTFDEKWHQQSGIGRFKTRPFRRSIRI